MRKLKLLIAPSAFIIFMLIPLAHYGKDKNSIEGISEKCYTIENCVNKIARDKADKTNSGCRYWFADTDFIDGRRLKMSLVTPNQATHAPHKHEVDEFFFIV